LTGAADDTEDAVETEVDAVDGLGPGDEDDAATESETEAGEEEALDGSVGAETGFESAEI
jgi:hypothetical protein